MDPGETIWYLKTQGFVVVVVLTSNTQIIAIMPKAWDYHVGKPEAESFDTKEALNWW